MNLQNIFDSTDFVHASGTKEELAVAEFLKAPVRKLRRSGADRIVSRGHE